ncbi:hypothetical protein A9G35_01680 [Gilliamella sp. Choc5-1]|uniref:hypothetical protein n=1 Tax=Gilliamella sp. Choc5-1 TaxID=3120238 RepID=UPI00080DD263|nr:hypothetical protein [Gilliamella apicola]OCG48448.1 hypothetical protein A9G35_01680 [Gilliamella apicola]
MKKIILLLIICLVLTTCNKAPLEKILNDIEENSIKTVKLTDYTDFKWDEVWLISGNISGYYLKFMRDQGIDVKKVQYSDTNTDFGIYQKHSDTIVYVYNKKVVYYEFPPDNRDREFYSLAPVVPYALLDLKLPLGQIIILSNKNSECEVNHKELIPLKPIKIYENMDVELRCRDNLRNYCK